ncbi:MAG TPA: hypothetical protein VF449_07305 [Parvibaculum sp.]
MTALAISLMPLSACATAASDTACLHPRAYTKTEQAEVADELEKLGPTSTAGKFIADYGTLRDEARAMCK